MSWKAIVHPEKLQEKPWKEENNTPKTYSSAGEITEEKQVHFVLRQQEY